MRLVAFLDRTWLATALFVLVSVSIYWGWFSWDSARAAIVPTIVLSPITWWAVVGRKRQPGLVRGALGGALVGPVTQALPVLLPLTWRAHTKPGLGNGEGQAVAMATVFVYLVVGMCSVPIGGLVGLIAVVIQRRVDKWIAGVADAPKRQ